MTRIFLLVSNLLIGLGGISGGVMALSSSARASVGINETMLIHSPFTTFLIPGLFLLFIIGCGNLLVGLLGFKHFSTFSYYECLIGLILVMWIFIQCLMLWSIVALHVIFFFLGILQFTSGILLIQREKVPFPFSAVQH
ncbi:hypothetical protein [Enterococcus termitis]|uniref:DUF4064 domain-containing protein n=1 Tax=Enterococcus termitis TaxID=332950 RepID=A0A1E5GD52_9ENTE|nr:hypothetical protein [Enterococcus termitis]OEG10638.1 hypothetical protein BCR25_09240 [Enterococcus termitis]OJG97901.1 hypothetical protein RV18_GL003915 [Enterococcus termitis]